MGGGATHFVEKIWEGIRDPNDNSEILFYSDNGKRFDPYSAYAPKIHTIREDPHNRWKVGMKIHPVIGNRTPNRFQFAPTLTCTCADKIWITPDARFRVILDGHILTDQEIHTLALNDGFESVKQFFQWFNEPFVGKLIHWTDFKY